VPLPRACKRRITSTARPRSIFVVAKAPRMPADWCVYLSPLPRRQARLGLVAALLAGGVAARAQSIPDFEQPPTNYSKTEPRDAIARLQQRLAAGELAFAGNEQEVLRALLRALRVPLESQVLVFSKTSLQRGRIRPDRPRALYFSDTVYVGWVPGGLIEVTAIDPQLGPVFYALDPRTVRPAERIFTRDADCLRCHGGNFVRDIPGIFVRSVVPDASGEPLFRHGTELVDDQTPFARRWGGWYVTGYSGAEPHRGNIFGTEQGEQLTFEPTKQRPADASALFDTAPYPTNTSDVVSLLVLEHQITVQNALTHAAQHCRKMIAYQHSLQKTFGEQITDEPAYDSVKSVFAGAVDTVVDRLLFRGAAPLPAGVAGRADFQRAFAAEAPRSRAGHALKDFQLRDRLFAQRCSFLIYSEMFTTLPATLQERILDRLYAALREEDRAGRYAYLEADEKRRILEILRETHPAARSRWEILAGRETSR
jgi:hypothetical protein